MTEYTQAYIGAAAGTMPQKGLWQAALATEMKRFLCFMFNQEVWGHPRHEPLVTGARRTDSW